jgi:putative transposase
MKEQAMSDENPMGQMIQIDEARIRDHLGEMVRGTVEETLNAMLDAEADELCGAGRYERSQARQDTRAGSYDRTLQTSAGEVSLKVPKLRRQTFETAIIERYRRRESSVEEALIEMYLAGISVRRVEDITEALWGTRVSPSTVSNLNKKIYAKIEAWRNRRIEGEHPFTFRSGLRRSMAQLDNGLIAWPPLARRLLPNICLSPALWPGYRKSRHSRLQIAPAGLALVVDQEVVRRI